MAAGFELVVSGRLALPDGRVVAGELGIADGRIAAIGEVASLDGAERLDGGDLLVLPGMVDTHVHTRSEEREGIAATTAAAAAGGVTTIVDMPYDAGGLVSTRPVFERKVADVQREAVVDVALYATIAPHDGLDEIAGLVEAGACAFKVSLFETDPVRFPRIDDGELYLAMGRIRDAGSLIAFHAESDEIVRRLTRALAEAGRTDAMVHADARPAVAETEAIGRVLELALATGARVHLVHVSVERGFSLIERARRDGIDVTAETCTHYLLLDEGDLVRQGPRAKINPPLRPRAEVEALWRLLAAGEVDWITSDHVGWAAER
jgi:allantoinase